MTFKEYLIEHKGYTEPAAARDQSGIDLISADFEVDINAEYEDDPSFESIKGQIRRQERYIKNGTLLIGILNRYAEYRAFLRSAGEEDLENGTGECWREVSMKVRYRNLGIKKFNEGLRRIDLTELDAHPMPETYRIRYDRSVAEAEKIPGLIGFIERELELIESFFEMYYGCERAGRPENLRILLSPLHKTKTYCFSTGQGDIRALIRKYESNGVYAVPTAELKKELKGKEVKFTDTIAGEYCHRSEEGPEIIIYYRVLDSSDIYAYAADLRRVLSHECLHAFHAASAQCTFMDDTYTAHRVKEALADFFCMTYCLAEQTNRWGRAVYSASLRKAEKTYNRWKERKGTGWPYAYALYFMILSGGEMEFSRELRRYQEAGCIDKYSNVWYESHSSMDDAYHELIS